MTYGVYTPVLNALFDEVTALRTAANDAQEALAAAKAAYEAMRPHWAMGYTSDSLAAQGSTAALSQLWQMLAASSQTEAVQTLQDLYSLFKIILEMADEVDDAGPTGASYKSEWWSDRLREAHAVLTKLEGRSTE